jgi:hypothetical protein
MKIIRDFSLSVVVVAVALPFVCSTRVSTALPGSLAASAQVPAGAAEEVSAKIWVGRAQVFEEYLKTAEIVSIEDIGVGVTHPQRAHLAPGGLCESMTWKPVRPGLYGNFWESYRSEIAAYEIDKLLGLEMVPPTVERQVGRAVGAAILWATPTQSFGDLGGQPTAPPKHFASWNRQMVQAKMFDNLIGNRDPNLGNWLVDPAWNLILIDHTRALTGISSQVHKLTRIDAALWDRMKALTEESLTAAVGQWIGRGEIRAILERRKRMQQDIDKLVEKHGEAAVFIR